MPLRPPVVALLCLLIGLALFWLTPTLRFSFPAQQLLGVALALAGFALAATAIRLFLARGTTPEPTGTPTVLVTTGPYRFTRNPMYLSMLIILLGIALFAGSLALLLAPLAFFLIINARQIPFEESRLTTLFGDDYAAFRRRTRRWL